MNWMTLLAETGMLNTGREGWVGCPTSERCFHLSVQVALPFTNPITTTGQKLLLVVIGFV